MNELINDKLKCRDHRIEGVGLVVNEVIQSNDILQGFITALSYPI